MIELRNINFRYAGGTDAGGLVNIDLGCRDLQVCANLPVGNGIDLQRFKRRDTGLVIGVEVQLRVKRLQTKAAGVQHIVGFQISLALDLLCHVYKTDP